MTTKLRTDTNISSWRLILRKLCFMNFLLEIFWIIGDGNHEVPISTLEIFVLYYIITNRIYGHLRSSSSYWVEGFSPKIMIYSDSAVAIKSLPKVIVASLEFASNWLNSYQSMLQVKPSLLLTAIYRPAINISFTFIRVTLFSYTIFKWSIVPSWIFIKKKQIGEAFLLLFELNFYGFI